jgi:2-iminoacetate synthase ThiH
MGNVQMTPEELEAMLDRAARKGARAALQELGLHDENAPKDLDELRGLLSAWRETRSTMWQTVVRLATGGVLLFIAGAVWLSVKDNITGQ